MIRSQAEPLIRKVDCIRLYVSDLDAGLAFYRDRLGHALIWRTPEHVGLRLQTDHSPLTKLGLTSGRDIAPAFEKAMRLENFPGSGER